MGGLVIKRAYILARSKQEYASLAERVQTIFFLATPHRGSDLAPLLSKILNLSSAGARPFVTDLHRNSLTTQSINDEFPQYCQQLQLFSFYETVPTSYGVGKSLVVGQDLATLGYANERREYLNANHREVCKYDSSEDANYRTVRNALASVTDVIRSRHALAQLENDNDKRKVLDKLLGVSEAPEDELMGVDSVRMSGSCEWLIRKRSFQQWHCGGESQIYSICAKPATGKTVLSGRTIAYLKERYEHCNFYFFRYGDKGKSNIKALLLSLAWQMARSDTEIFDRVLDVFDKDELLSKADYRVVWRKLYLEGILTMKNGRVHYWVIDALDECMNESELCPLLVKGAGISSLRIFLTSRNRFVIPRRPDLLKVQVIFDQISEEDSRSDITLYLEAHMDDLTVVDKRGRQQMVDRILEKSAGCFLWVSLIFQELRNVHTSSDVRKILDEVPSDMNDLFGRILDLMSAATYGKALAKAILTWTVCSVRPLKTSELYDALQLDLEDLTDSVEGSIGSCGQLVYVDAQSQVQMIHLTARDFLLRTDMDSEFAVDGKEGHRRLLLTCLKYLSSDDMKAPRRRKLSASNLPKERSYFARYACESLFEHISHVSSMDDQILFALVGFFQSPAVLSWIEYIAKHSDLNRVIQTGKALSKILQRGPDHMSSSNKDEVLLASWATDLVHLVMKFGKNLTASPYAIFNLIPPFCPPETAPWRQCGITARGISVSGLRAKTWDDCLSTIVNPREQYSSLATSKSQFAIGTYSGKILLYKQTTCQELDTLRHEEPVRLLKFGARRDRVNTLVSGGSRTIRVWDLGSKTQTWRLDAYQQCMSLALADNDQFLLGALKDHRLKYWDLTSGHLTENIDWTQGLEDMTKQLYRRPITAAFNADADLLAVIYKGQDILLWDLESDSLYDTYNRESGASAIVGRPYGSSGVRCLVFGVAVNSHLLAAAYGDGELVLFDTSTGELKIRIVAFAHILTCSIDGSTLASADPSGMIQLFNFETMHLLYRIHSVEPGIQDLAFSGDGLRLLDIRGSNCRLWDPAVLVGDDEPRGNLITSTSTQETDLGLPPAIVLITSVACHDSGEMFFCGKEDGSVYLYDVNSGLQSRQLFSHAHGVSIVILEFEERSQTISSIDSSSRIMIHKLERENRSMVANEVLFDHRADTAVGQLVCQKGLKHVLVCSAKSDTLWSISQEGNNIVETILYQDREPYRWARHPVEQDYLILIARTEAHIYDWRNLERLTKPAGILLEGSILPELSIRSLTPCFDGTILATTFSESLRAHSKSKLVLWKASDFTPESEVAAPVPNYHYLADQVEVLIGTTAIEPEQPERLVFLQASNWVCGADSPSAKADQYVRHFFFPADWLSTSVELIFEVTKKGDILLVKRDEVAVVKRGLLTRGDAETGGGMPGARRLSSNQRARKAATLRVPSSP